MGGSRELGELIFSFNEMAELLNYEEQNIEEPTAQKPN